MIAAGLSIFAAPAGVWARTVGARGPDHPEPRPGIDGSRVLKAEDLKDTPDLIPLYDGIRRIPHIADGIRCACGCADVPDFRSLLTCFENTHMAMHCQICQSVARLVIELHDKGADLARIRAAVDEKFS